MLIAIDANIWLSERLFRSATGAAFLHALRRTDARILLPGVTRDEIIAGTGRMGLKSAAHISAELARVRSLTGTAPDVQLPTEEEFRDAAVSRIGDMAPLLLQVDITRGQMDCALARLHNHVPPAATREQYRDCLLWESLLDSRDGQSALVTADSDFLEGGKGARNLSPVLQAECEGEVTHYSSLSDFLLALEPRVEPVDFDAVLIAIRESLRPTLESHADKHGYTLGSEAGARLELFATENVGETAAVFSVNFRAFDFPLPDLSAIEEVDLVVSGSCIVDPENAVTRLALDEVRPKQLDGENLPGGIVYLSGSMGRRDTPYVVRAPILPRLA